MRAEIVNDYKLLRSISSTDLVVGTSLSMKKYKLFFLGILKSLTISVSSVSKNSIDYIKNNLETLKRHSLAYCPQSKNILKGYEE